MPSQPPREGACDCLPRPGDAPDSVAIFPGDIPAEPSKMTASASHPDLLGGWEAWAEAPAPAPASEGTSPALWRPVLRRAPARLWCLCVSGTRWDWDPTPPGLWAGAGGGACGRLCLLTATAARGPCSASWWRPVCVAPLPPEGAWPAQGRCPTLCRHLSFCMSGILSCWECSSSELLSRACDPCPLSGAICSPGSSPKPEVLTRVANLIHSSLDLHFFILKEIVILHVFSCGFFFFKLYKLFVYEQPSFVMTM